MPGGADIGRTDLWTQLEALFDQVWRSEAEWRFDDRIDLACRLVWTRPLAGPDGRGRKGSGPDPA